MATPGLVKANIAGTPSRRWLATYLAIAYGLQLVQKKWQRAQGLDSIPYDEARLYQQYIEFLDDLFPIKEVFVCPMPVN
ncbi:MAG: hypothetical protein R3E31_19115 [Chloroflexota bacterium]